MHIDSNSFELHRTAAWGPWGGSPLIANIFDEWTNQTTPTPFFFFTDDCLVSLPDGRQRIRYAYIAGVRREIVEEPLPPKEMISSIPHHDPNDVRLWVIP